MAKLVPVLLLAVFLTFVIASFTSKLPKSGGSALPAATGDSIPELEIKKYWMVMLKTGVNHMQDPASATLIETAHMNTIRSLVEEGKLIVAGPFDENDELRGVFIMDCKDSLEVASLLKRDTAIATGWLKAEIRPWWTAKNCLFK